MVLVVFVGRGTGKVREEDVVVVAGLSAAVVSKDEVAEWRKSSPLAGDSAPLPESNLAHLFDSSRLR